MGDNLDAFIAWVDHMKADMLASALELDGSFDRQAAAVYDSLRGARVP